MRIKMVMAAVSVAAGVAVTWYGLNSYKNRTILSDQPRLLRFIFGNEGVLDNSSKSREIVLDAIKSAEDGSIFGSVKLHDNLLTNEGLHKAFTDNKGIFVGTENRLSDAEKVQTQQQQAAQAGVCANNSRLDRDQRMEGRVFGFENCANAHVKFLLTPQRLFVGTTNYDIPRTMDGKPFETWYGAEENNSDFIIVIEDRKLIARFASHLIGYLPKHIIEKMNSGFKELATSSLNSTQDNALMEWDRVKKGVGSTMFACGPFGHKAVLLSMINDAKESVYIVQQDLQDEAIQGALMNKARCGTKIEITMSKHPFRKDKENVSMSFLERLKREVPNVVVNILENKGVHSKVMIVDQKFMYLGSANFYPQVLDPQHNNLNVGIVTSDVKFVQPVINSARNFVNVGTL